MTRRESRAWKSKHEKIIAAALDEFIASGYDGASMDRIAGRAQVSKVTIYNHFKNKDELYDQVLDVHLKHLAGLDYGLEIPANKERRPEDALKRFGRRLLEVFLDPETIGVTRLLAIDAFRKGEREARGRPSGLTTGQARLHEYLDLEVRSGRLRIQKPELAARQFVGMLLENTFHSRLWGGDVDHSEAALQTVIDSSVRVFLDHYEVR